MMAWHDVLNVELEFKTVTGGGVWGGGGVGVSRKSGNFSGAFRVTYFFLYRQNEGVSRYETLQLF